MAKPTTTTIITDTAVEESAEITIPAGTYMAVDGDSYASIADKFKPAKMSKHEYAVELFEKNAGKTLDAGIIITL